MAVSYTHLYNEEETIGTAHEKDDTKMEGMTEEDRERCDENCTQMKNERTGVYAQVTEEYTCLLYTSRCV